MNVDDAQVAGEFPLIISWLCLKMGYTPNEIAIKSRDNDQQNHWVNGVHYFQTNPHFWEVIGEYERVRY